MTDKLKVFHVGCGGISEQWLDAMSQDNRIEYIGICDINIDAAIRKMNQYKLSCQVYSDYKKGILECQPDVVVDNTVPNIHYSVADFALENCCHVFTEKPLSDDMNNAIKIYKKSLNKNKNVFVMQNRRYLSKLWALKNAVDSNCIGDVNSVSATFATEAHFGGFREEMDYPLLMEMSVHTFDQARFLMKANPVSVYCHCYNAKDSWYDGDASAVCIFEMDNNAVFTYNGTWTARGNLTSWESQWSVQGTKGAAYWDGAQLPWYEIKSDDEKDSMFPTKYQRTIVEDIPMQIEHKGCIDNMITSLIAGEKAMTDIGDNIMSLAMVIGAIESEKTGSKINIKDLMG